MSFRFPQPDNEDDFELFCLRFLRELWNCQSLQRYGKRGERQFGIDLIDESGGSAGSPFRAIQCKHHESDKTIPPAEIGAEVTKALGAGLPLDEYYILTTARKTTQATNAIIQINRDHAVNGRFVVSLWTWDDIEERLSELDDIAQDRALRGDSGRSGPAICQMLSAVLTEHLDGPPNASGSTIDSELDAIKNLIDRHEIEVAETKLKQLEEHSADKLQEMQWYIVKVYRFRLLAHRWQWEQAARVLLDAKRHAPNTERARINEALGYELLGDREKAHAIATVLRGEFAQSARLITIWVRTAPPSTTFDSLLEVADPFANDEEELNLALAQRAFLEDRLDDGLNCARRATEIDTDSPHAWFVLGQAKHLAGFNAARGIQTERLREAEQHYDRAVQLAHAQRLFGLEAAIRFNRGKVRHLLGDQCADTDFAAAVELAASDSEYRTEYAGFLLELGRQADAIKVLAAIPGERIGAQLFYEAAARYERNVGDDRTLALDLLRRLISSDDSSDRWADACALFVQCAVENGTQDEARSIIEGTKLQESSPLIYHTALGLIAKSEGKIESARNEFRDAEKAVAGGTSKTQLYLVAQALVAVGEDELALPLLQRCYRPGVFNVECRKLLDTAQRLNRHDVAAKVCRELREAGASDPRIIQTEISILQLYDPNEALRVAQEYLTTHPDDRHVALWQSFLAIRLDRRELIISDLARLPAVDDLTPEGTGMVLRVLCETDQFSEGLQYAYDALRAHFDKEFAHRQYIGHFLKLFQHCAELRGSERVGPGMAVCYREDHSNTEQWVIIEDGADPQLGRDEYATDHPISKAMAGHAIGDAVVVCDMGVQARTVTIRQLAHKYLYRFQDCRDRYQLRFQGGSAIQLIHLGSDEEFDLTPIIRSLEERRRYIEKLDQQFRTSPMPFSMYTELSGTDELAAWGHLSSGDDLGVRCSSGNTDELKAAIGYARNSKTFVLDLTSLITLARLELLGILQTVPRSFVVAQNTFDRLQHLVEMAEENAKTDGTFAYSHGGRLALEDVTAQQRQQHAEFLIGIRNVIRTKCQILPCPQAAGLDPKKREQLIKALGRHNLESILLAMLPGAALWTDDLVLGVIGRTDFQIRSVWTQPVLFAMRQDSVTVKNEYQRSIAKLVAWNYQGILFDAETFLAAADVAGWHMDQFPIRKMMRSLGTTTGDRFGRLATAIHAIVLVWQTELPPLVRQSFVFALLAGLKSERLIRRLPRMVTELFGYDVESAEEVRDCIALWLRQPTGLILP